MAVDRHARALGQRIVRARGKRSQQWLADQVGAQQGSVSNWELGKVVPKREYLDRLERVLELPAGSLWNILAAGGRTRVVDPADERAEALKQGLSMIDAFRDELNTSKAQLDRLGDRLDQLEAHVRQNW